MVPIAMEWPADGHNFDADAYMRANPDVAEAVRAGTFGSARAHFDGFGEAEGRMQRGSSEVLEAARRAKMERVLPWLREDMRSTLRGSKPDYLTAELRAETRIADTDRVSANAYDGDALGLIEDCRDGLVLDCGAGRRSVYYGNVVNYEIVDYDSTDVLGVGEELPFKDGAFDAVISVAVLEHVRDPFRCAREIARVLKPGGRLLCSVPFLQPEHGYPHHYYNMAPQGLRALWEDMLTVDEHKVVSSTLPVWTLTWFLKSWRDGLPEEAAARFDDLRVGDLVNARPFSLLGEDWVAGLSPEKNMELACATLLKAHKAA